MTTSGGILLDTATPESLLEAADKVETVESSQDQKIAGLKKIDWRRGWMDSSQLMTAAGRLAEDRHCEYFRVVAEDDSPEQ